MEEDDGELSELMDNRIPGLIRAETDEDPLLFSYYNDETEQPEVIVCNVDTPTADPTLSVAGVSDNPLTSTGRYTVLVPAVNKRDGTLTWENVKDEETDEITGMDVRFQLNQTVNVVGNPYGIVVYDGYGYTVGYDSAKIFRFSVEDLKTAPKGGVCEVTIAADVESVLNPESEFHHGTTLITLPDALDEPVFFALYSNTDEDSAGDVEEQNQSTLVRLTLKEDGTLAIQQSINVPPNATGLHPFVYEDKLYIIIPSIGGIQNASITNGIKSAVTMLPAFAPSWAGALKYLIVGDPHKEKAEYLTPEQAYDVHGIAFSEDGNWAYLLTMSYNTSDYLTCWRVYAMDLLGILEKESTSPADDEIHELVDAHLLVPVGSGFDEPTAYYCELIFENPEKDEDGKNKGPGRLWFLNGDRIRVSAGNDFTHVIKEITSGSGGNLYSPTFHINSADLLGEMLNQAARRNAVNTRLGRLSHLAQAVYTAKAKAAARDAEGEAEEIKDKG
jgi:hypothetical protein